MPYYSRVATLAACAVLWAAHLSADDRIGQASTSELGGATVSLELGPTTGELVTPTPQSQMALSLEPPLVRHVRNYAAHLTVAAALEGGARQQVDFLGDGFFTAVDELHNSLLDINHFAADPFINRFNDITTGLEEIDKVVTDLGGFDNLSVDERHTFADFILDFELQVAEFSHELDDLENSFDPESSIGTLVGTVNDGVITISDQLLTLEMDIRDSAEDFLQNEFDNAVNTIPTELEGIGEFGLAEDFTTIVDDLTFRTDDLLNTLNELELLQGDVENGLNDYDNLTDAERHDLADIRKQLADDRAGIAGELATLQQDLVQFQSDLDKVAQDFVDELDLSDTINIVQAGLSELNFAIVDAIDEGIVGGTKSFLNVEFQRAVDTLSTDLENAGFQDEANSIGPAVNDLIQRTNEVNNIFQNGFADLSLPDLNDFVDDVERLHNDLATFRDDLIQAEIEVAEDPTLAGTVGESLAVVNAGLTELEYSLVTDFDQFLAIFDELQAGIGGLGEDDDFVADIGRMNTEIAALRDELETLFPGEADALIAEILADNISTIEIHEFISEVRQQGESANEYFDSDETRSNTIGYLSAIRKRSAERPRRTAADQWVTNLELRTSFSYASFTNRDAGGSGHDMESDMFLTGMFGDATQFGVGSSYARYTIDNIAYERQSRVFEFYVNQIVTDRLSLGMFLNHSAVDIEEVFRTFFVPALGANQTVKLHGDTYDRWGVGLLASLGFQVSDIDIGFTTSLASGNKRSLERILDNEDTAVASMLDVRVPINDWLAATSFVTYYAEIDNERVNGHKVDGSFWTVGGDLEWRPNDRIAVTLGYETTLAYEDFHEHRLNGSVGWYW